MRTRSLLAAAVVLMALSLSGCGWLSRDLRDPRSGKTATCTFGLVVGDMMSLPPSHPYCKCISDHLAAGYETEGPPRLYLCRGLGKDQ